MLYPTIAANQLTRLPSHWVAITSGDADLIVPTPPPDRVGDPMAALARGHARSIARQGFQQAANRERRPERDTTPPPGRDDQVEETSTEADHRAM
jgi:hypothetical protein